jgi:hypothetical protein
MEGYELDVQNDVHRQNLVKDARFYNLRHLAESLTPSRIHTNPFRGNARELLISLTDFRSSNCRIAWVENAPYGWLEYKRAHDVDKEFLNLLLQIDDDGFIMGAGKIMLINRTALNGMKALKEIAEDRKTEARAGVLGPEFVVRIEIPGECHCVIDGTERIPESLFEGEGAAAVPSVAGENAKTPSVKKRKFDETEEDREDATSTSQRISTVATRPKSYALKRSMWRVKVKGNSVPGSSAATTGTYQQQVAAGRRNLVLVAVKLEGWTREREFAKELSWL